MGTVSGCRVTALSLQDLGGSVRGCRSWIPMLGCTLGGCLGCWPVPSGARWEVQSSRTWERLGRCGV